MGLRGLHHYTIRAADLEATKSFYVDVLGLEVGYRPPFSFPGYWLYVGSEPTVHLVGPRETETGQAPRQPAPTGLMDHVAFSCDGLAGMKDRLASGSIAYEERVLPRDRQTQLFLRDPDGIMVELSYPTAETAGD